MNKIINETTYLKIKSTATNQFFLLLIPTKTSNKYICKASNVQKIEPQVNPIFPILFLTHYLYLINPPS